MYKFCVFAGTTEGRKLIDFLVSQPVSVTACVATEYGETLLPTAENLLVSAKRLTYDEMVSLFNETAYDLVIDATHPYAPVVTDNIRHACLKTATRYLRLLRDASGACENAVYVADTAAAVKYLNTTEGNILLTTGSKELSEYTALEGFAERVYARVLPMAASLAACETAGLKPARVIAMQGPFSEETNLSLLHHTSARFLVTKDGGETGGFGAKASAAQKSGATLVVIGRPPQSEGISYTEVTDLLCAEYGCSRRPVVSIIGIGPGSHDVMTAEVRTAAAQAECLIGAKRMLEAIASPSQATFEAIAPQAIADCIAENRIYGNFAVVMSGDTGFFSGTKKLLPLLKHCELRVYPGISSLSYLCAKLHTSYEDTAIVSLHGRTHNIAADIRANRQVFALVGGADGARELCRSMTEAGLGNLTVHIGQRLSYPDEQIFSGTAKDLSERSFAPLSVVLIQNPAPDAVVTHGLPDEVFLRGSGEGGVIPMTKSEIRSICLSRLQLTERAVCWDIGAGTGSVSIEMALQARKGRVYAIEQKPEACSLLRQNISRFSADNLSVICGEAPEACRELPAPTHAFVGGSSGNMREILSLLREKNPKVRVVATAIALESAAELTACINELPDISAEVTCVNISRGKKAGRYHLMTANNPIYIYTICFGGPDA